MTRLFSKGCSTWTVAVLAVATLALAGCGRRAALDRPAVSQAVPLPEDDGPAVVGRSGYEPVFGNEAPPTAARGRNRGFILDPLLN